MAGRGRAGDRCSLARRSVGFNLAGTAATSHLWWNVRPEQTSGHFLTAMDVHSRVRRISGYWTLVTRRAGKTTVRLEPDITDEAVVGRL